MPIIKNLLTQKPGREGLGKKNKRWRNGQISYPAKRRVGQSELKPSQKSLEAFLSFKLDQLAAV
jgi:hypothetical protein